MRCLRRAAKWIAVALVAAYLLVNLAAWCSLRLEVTAGPRRDRHLVRTAHQLTRATRRDDQLRLLSRLETLYPLHFGKGMPEPSDATRQAVGECVAAVLPVGEREVRSAALKLLVDRRLAQHCWSTALSFLQRPPAEVPEHTAACLLGSVEHAGSALPESSAPRLLLLVAGAATGAERADALRLLGHLGSDLGRPAAAAALRRSAGEVCAGAIDYLALLGHAEDAESIAAAFPRLTDEACEEAAVAALGKLDGEEHAVLFEEVAVDPSRGSKCRHRALWWLREVQVEAARSVATRLLDGGNIALVDTEALALNILVDESTEQAAETIGRFALSGGNASRAVGALWRVRHPAAIAQCKAIIDHSAGKPHRDGLAESCVRVLRGRPEGERFKVMENLLSDTRPFVRGPAALELAEATPDGGLGDLLMQRLQTETHDQVRADLLTALAVHGEAKHVSALRNILKQERTRPAPARTKRAEPPTRWILPASRRRNLFVTVNTNMSEYGDDVRFSLVEKLEQTMSALERGSAEEAK